ncbi:unnamed protein product [Microthlaspi erraticum]|uniref:Reverse transcriptase RNase H-like domain-containing protein n=1 Tax=Microthlaspi erraticum TaxID=1685480 RepID=A0A6D2JWF2_9BRAS|nr:unnamed protein product [Microthlaspi erraticum]
MPFPGRFKKQLLEAHKAKFVELMRQLELKLPFIDALMPIPPYRKFLKDAVQQRTREAQGMVVLTRECSAIIQRKVISKKKEDPGSFTLPCMLGPLSFKNSLCDLGSSVSLIPLSVAKKLGYHKYQACGISLVLADRSIRLPTGMLEDLPLRIGNVEIPTDFIVLEMDEEPTDPLILGRPFLATARAMIDVCEGTIELNLGNDLRMKFDIKDTMRKPTIEGQLFYVEEMDQLADELLEELSLEDPLQVALTKDSSEGYVSSETDEYKRLLDTFRPVPNILSIEGLDRPVCEVMPVSSIKSSIESGFEQTNSIELGTEYKEQAQGDWSELKAPKVDLKPLPEGLRYAFLGENSTYPVIEPQRRLNPNLKEVVKKEILKLLDAGIIYPISDSTWISPVHCVPKKGGINVIKNDKEELIPTRTIVEHRMCLDYRKLNSTSRKDFSKIARPLTRLLCKETDFEFDEECHKSWTLLKDALVSAPIVQAPNWDHPFEIMCDASDYAVGAVLGQKIDKKLNVIYYASKTMDDAQCKYATTEKELLAIVFAFEKFRSYIVGSKVIVHTDHAALRHIFAKKDTKPRLLRWILLLQEFDIEVVDKKGVENGVADHLSRMRVEDMIPINDSMPEEQLMAIMILKESFDEKVRLEEVKALRDENLPWYADIVNFMVSGEVPSSFDAYKRKKFFKDARHYYWDEPYLYKRGPDSIYRRCIAEEDVQGVLEHCHGSAYGGHFATFKTATRFCNLGCGGLPCLKMQQASSQSVIHAKGKEVSPREMKCH